MSNRAAQIGELISRIGGLQDLSPDADFFDAGFESINALELLLELETTFNITIPDDDFVACRSVDALDAMVERLTLSQGAAG